MSSTISKVETNLDPYFLASLTACQFLCSLGLSSNAASAILDISKMQSMYIYKSVDQSIQSVKVKISKEEEEESEKPEENKERTEGNQDSENQTMKNKNEQKTSDNYEFVVYPNESLFGTLQNDIENRTESQILARVNLQDAKKATVQLKSMTMRERILNSTKALSEFRYCVKCDDVKPPRSHHCSICKSCVMRMDHHCPWVGNCVGFKNHKYFINFLFYTALASFQVFITLLFNIPEGSTLKQHFVYMNKDVGNMLTFTLTLSFFLACSGMCAFHIYLILKNKSTIEMQMLEFNNIFDISRRANWEQVFGKDWKTWFIPIEPKRTINGIFYPVNTLTTPLIQ